MNFRRRKVNGRTKASYREWHDAEGLGYRVSWRSEVEGVKVRPGYHACVLSVAPYQNYEFWSFSTARRPFKTLALAVEACENNERLWRHFLTLADERKGRAEKVRALDAKAQIGHGAAAHKIMSIIPVWVNKVVPSVLLRILYPIGKRECDEDQNDQNDPAPILPAIEQPSSGDELIDSSSSTIPITGLVSVVTAEASSKGRIRRGAGNRATGAKAPAVARGKRSKKHTTKKSKAGKKKSVATKG